MSNTALPAIHLRSKARITVEADQPLAWELDQYKAFYAQVHGAPVEEADLLREMARAFMASDREFQRFRRKSLNGRRRSSSGVDPNHCV